MRSLRSCHQRRREAAMAPVLPDACIFDCCCWSWQQHPPHLQRAPLPASSPETPASLSLRFHSAGQTEEAVAREDHADVQRGDDDKQLKNRHDPLTEKYFSCAGSGCSCCHCWCRKQRRDGDASRRTFLISRPLVRLSLERLRLLLPARWPCSSLFSQNRVFFFFLSPTQTRLEQTWFCSHREDRDAPCFRALSQASTGSNEQLAWRSAPG